MLFFPFTKIHVKIFNEILHTKLTIKISLINKNIKDQKNSKL